MIAGAVPDSSCKQLCFLHHTVSIVCYVQVKPQVLTALSADRQFQVWGSSTGWLVFYGALTYGLEAVGK